MKKIYAALVGVVLISLMIASNTRLAGAGVWVPKVLIDARTSWWSYYGEYSGAIGILIANGYTVDTLTTGTITSTLLNDYCCLVLVTGDQGYSTSEINDILAFVNGGGGLVFLGEWGGKFSASSAESIASALGVTINHDTIYDEIHYDTAAMWPIIYTFPISHPVTSGVTTIVYGCGATLSVDSPAVTIATGGADTYAVADPSGTTPGDAGVAEGLGGSYEPVLAVSTYGDGRAVITGDSDLFDSGTAVNGIVRGDNAVLWSNIFLWLCPPMEHIIPEVPFGTIVASASMIMGLLGFFLIPRLKRKQSL